MRSVAGFSVGPDEELAIHERFLRHGVCYSTIAQRRTQKFLDALGISLSSR